MHRPGVITALLLILAVAFNSGCDTLNVGTETVIRPLPLGDITVTSAATMNAGELGTITVPWYSGNAPFTIEITIGNANVPAGTAAGTSPYTFDFILEEGTINWTVTVTDANGYSGTETGTYTAAPPVNYPPVIDNVAIAGNVVTVTVSDLEGDDVTVSVTDIAGLIVDSNTYTVNGGNGDAVFNWILENEFTSVTGTTTISAWDAAHTDNPATDSANLSIGCPVLMPDEGALWALPMASTCAVGDTMTILVISGPFPEDAAFNYLNGVAVTVPDGGDYVTGTFNVGSIGGEIKDVDGIWADMDPAPSTFFVPEDFMMAATDVTADSSLDFMGFNITPIGAGEVTGGGELFNFGMYFDAAGEYELGFIEFQDVKRTYYKDGNGTEYNWTDIDNEHEVSTAITVTE